ncbi:MAG: signal peptidase II [Candidatus Babeliales bacterium]
MKKLVSSLSVFSLVLFLDRVTKYWAYHYAQHTIAINKFFSLSLTFNRGISWGIGNGASSATFVLISCMVAILCSSFGYYMVQRYQEGSSIVPELCIFAGGISNVIDRVWYHGVIDFIELHYGAWYWPSFNVADMAIVIGVVILMVKMLIPVYGENFSKKNISNL